MPPSDDPGLPLAGIRVYEIGSSVAAPYGTWILAALGADVFKIERPGTGDDARAWGPPFWQETSTLFHVLNRDKRSLVVDMKDAGALAQLRRTLAGDADVVVQNLRPGLVRRYGLDADSLRGANPRLVYCNIGAFGAGGPLSEKPGYDPLMQAYGGLMSVTGEGDRPPLRLGISAIDMGTGMWCAIGILAMLRQRQATGEGGVVDASLYETALGWMTYHLADYQATGETPRGHGTGIRGIAPYQAYECADGALMVAAPNDALFAKLCQALGHSEWADDGRFADNPRRFANLGDLNALIAPVMAGGTRADWRRALDAAGIPNAPVQSADEVYGDAQTEALGILQSLDDGMRLVGLPISFDGRRPPLRNRAPGLGEANSDIFGGAAE